MLFWIILVLAIAAIVWVVWDENNVMAGPVSAIMLITLVVSLCVFGCCNINVDGMIAADQKRYESLVYQYENDMYDNDNDLGKYELMQRIEDWNKELASYRAAQYDFWIGIYIPNIFDQYKFIELK